MRCNIYRLLIGSEIQFGQLHFNCVSSGFPMSLFMPHGMCRIYACSSVVLSLHFSPGRWCWESRLKWGWTLQRHCSCGMQLPAVWARLRDVAVSWLEAVASARRLLVYNWINNLLHFTEVFNIVISLSSNSHYHYCHNLCHCYVYLYTIILT